MPSAFTERERERISGKLLDAGFRLFTTQGLRKTSLDDLVRPAGIAKSTFYRFFDSKEELYVELMFRQVPRLREGILEVLADESLDVAERLRRYLHAALDIQRNNPLYRRLLTHPDELELVGTKVSPDRLEEAKRLIIEPSLDFLQRARKNGDLVDVEPGIVFGVVQAVLTVPLQEQMFDPASYEPALDLLIDIVATGLTRSR
ncbi:TetR/AcrR family transcriptional regulator [Microlunatus sp. GCM10028923]|uniref:TetR/AcrR family transcriptional regulator n=1 Tax=Microlunatus sp. GCM10028923 TaxID=3273400 RepID=UPI00361D6746